MEINENFIKSKIYTIRNKQVMLDSDLAEIYGYETKRFNQQVKNNIEKFDEDFRFQLNDEETKELYNHIKNEDCSRSNILTLNSENVDLSDLQLNNNLTLNVETKKRGKNIKYNPYVFTEQGIYMLMTVLRGELAIQQSKALIRTFKQMKDIIINQKNLSNEELAKLSIQTIENTRQIQDIKEKMICKKDLSNIMKNFINKNYKEFLIYNGKTVEGNTIYTKIYSLAKKTIYIVDNYISLRTLILLKNISEKVQITIFSDNIYKGLHKIEYEDFKKEYPNVKINFRKTKGIYHDRYIILDYKLKTERIYHCGTSSQTVGKRINTITQINDRKVYYKMINVLLSNPKLELK